MTVVYARGEFALAAPELMAARRRGETARLRIPRALETPSLGPTAFSPPDRISLSYRTAWDRGITVPEAAPLAWPII
jgi:hypothetical protein